MQSRDFYKRLSSFKSGAVWLGEHHNSVKDHDLQADIVRKLYQSRQGAASPSTGKSLGIGLEQVQVKFQGALDDYIDGKISATEMRELVEWDKRWLWSFEGYLPVFETARELGVPLVALNVNSEDLALVEKDGLPGLPRDRL